MTGHLSCHPRGTVNDNSVPGIVDKSNGAKFKYAFIAGYVEPVAHLAPALPAVEQDPRGAACNPDLALGGVRAVRLQGELRRLAPRRDRGRVC